MRKAFITVLTLYILILCDAALPGIDLSEFLYDYHEFAITFEDPNTGKYALPVLVVPVGGRFQSMGTAFTALSDDAGYIESNPAGSATMEYTELSLLHNNWIATSRMESLVYTSRIPGLDNLGLGIGGKFLYLPFTEKDHTGVEQNAGIYSESVLVANAALNLLSDYDWYGVSVGVNAKLGFRNIPDAISTTLSGATVMLDAGAISRFSFPFLKLQPFREPNVSVGAALRNIGLHLKGDPLPGELAIGAAFLPILPVTLTLDLNIPINLDFSGLLEGEFGKGEDINLSTGMDIRVTPFFAVQTGFRVDGSNPRFSMGSSLDLEDMWVHVNYTLGLDNRYNDMNKISIEVKLNLGDQQRKLKLERVEQLFAEALSKYAGAATKSDYDTALEKLDELLEIDPGYTPAVALRDLIIETLDKQQRLGDFGK